jgi:hypothetical protein
LILVERRPVHRSRWRSNQSHLDGSAAKQIDNVDGRESRENMREIIADDEQHNTATSFTDVDINTVPQTS